MLVNIKHCYFNSIKYIRLIQGNSHKVAPDEQLQMFQ